MEDPPKKGQNPPELARLPPTGDPRLDREAKFFRTANGEDRALPGFLLDDGVDGVVFLDEDVGVPGGSSPRSAMILALSFRPVNFSSQNFFNFYFEKFYPPLNSNNNSSFVEQRSRHPVAFCVYLHLLVLVQPLFCCELGSAKYGTSQQTGDISRETSIHF